MTGYTVAMVTFNLTKITITSLLMTGHLFDTIYISIKTDPSTLSGEKCWHLLLAISRYYTDSVLQFNLTKLFNQLTTYIHYLHRVCSLASILFKTMDLIPFIRPVNSSVITPRSCASLALVDDM